MSERSPSAHHCVFVCACMWRGSPIGNPFDFAPSEQRRTDAFSPNCHRKVVNQGTQRSQQCRHILGCNVLSLRSPTEASIASEDAVWMHKDFTTWTFRCSLACPAEARSSFASTIPFDMPVLAFTAPPWHGRTRNLEVLIGLLV